MVKNSETQLQEEFTSAWVDVFRDAPPLGYELRVRFAEKWTRFHALAQSKRYADTEDEQQEILHRANELAIECFDQDADIWLVTAIWDENNELAKREGMRPVLTWSDEMEGDGIQTIVEFWASSTRFTKGAFDSYFIGVADEEYRLVMFDPVKRIVLAPYDGGFDVIAFDPTVLASLEVKYAHWMSERSDKL